VSSSRTQRWEARTPAQVALLAMDICGFSRDPALNKLLQHRLAFFGAVQKSPTKVPRLMRAGTVKVQFLGDELRFAFHAGILDYCLVVREFIDNIFLVLADSSPRTKLRGLVLDGKLAWDEYHRCTFFQGTIANDCAVRLSGAEENEVLIDAKFLQALKSISAQTDLQKKSWPKGSQLERFEAYVLYPRAVAAATK
jgi:hypothetical protein